MPDERLILIDIDVLHWKVAETRLYRKAVGVNPEYALGMLQRAASESQAEMKAEFGEAEPPEGYLPMPLLNIDPAYLLGFAWMAARRSDKALTFDAYGDDLEIGELMGAFYAMTTEESEGDAPLEEEAPPPKARKNSSPSTPPSTSAAPTTGD